jgi:hypothetical protein
MMAVEAWFESSTARVAADRGATRGLPEGALDGAGLPDGAADGGLDDAGASMSPLRHTGRSMGVRMLDAFAARERASSPSTGSWMSQRPL